MIGLRLVEITPTIECRVMPFRISISDGIEVVIQDHLREMFTEQGLLIIYLKTDA